MPTMLSPGVYIDEVDASNIVPSVSNNVAFFAGNFNRGPSDQPYVITNKIELEEVFGTPSDVNYNEWFQCYKFFDYANQLVITRAHEEFDMNEIPHEVDNKQRLFKLYEDPEYTSGLEVIIKTKSSYDYTYSVGDWITLGGTIGVNNDILTYTVSKIETLEAENGSATDPTKDPRLTKVTLLAPIGTDSAEIQSNIDSVGADSDVFINSIRHLNGGTQALIRGTTADENAVSPENIDYVDQNAFQQDASPKRFAYNYDVIKNKDEFDYMHNQDVNPLLGFETNAKLKFFNRTSSTDVVEIAIANPEDFDYNNGENYAIAFSETNGTSIKNYYLTQLFHYPPQFDQIALAFKLNDQIETFIVSFDKLSVDGNNKSNYIEDVVNEQSKLLYVLDNTSLHLTNGDIDDRVHVPASYLVCDIHGWATDSTGKLLIGTVPPEGKPTTNLYSKGGRTPRVSIAAIRDAYFSVSDKELFEIDVVIGNEYNFNGVDDMNPAIELADTRKDCIAFIGARYEDCIDKKSGEATQNIINYIIEADPLKRDGSVKLTRTMFAAFFGNYFKIYDKYNRKDRYINCAGDCAGVRCQVSGSLDPWWVSAGIKRGVLRYINRLSFTPSLSQRDNLYKNGINPIVSFPGSGNLIWGNKTMHPLASSFDRINIRTLFNTMERAAAKAARSQVFEFNDAYTRNAMLSMFNPYLATIKAGRGIVDYLVICDETNNTPDIISRNELRVDIYIKPNYAAEFILLTFTNVGTRSFASVVGA